MRGADYLAAWGFSLDDLNATWQRQPAHRPGEAGRFLRYGAVEWGQISVAAAARAEILTVHLDAKLIPVTMYSRSAVVGGRERDGFLNFGALEELTSQGATVIAANVEEYLPEARSCAAELEEHFDMAVEAHVFSTPAQAPGIPIHADGEENFLLQLHGEKRWELWRPQRAAKIHYSREELGNPSCEILLTAGDVLYIPLGWPHHGRAGTKGSSHITYQILPSENQD